MDWTGAAAAAALSGAGLLALLWAGDALEDEHGHVDVNTSCLVTVGVAAAAGAVGGAVHGVLGGLAVVSAGANVFVSVLMAWALAGGDGQADSVPAALLGLVVLFGSLSAFGVAVSGATGAGMRDLAALLVPALAWVLAQPFTRPPGRRKAAVTGGGLLALPGVLLALA